MEPGRDGTWSRESRRRAEVMPLDEAGKAAALADADDIHLLALLKQIHQHLIAGLGIGARGHLDFAQQAAGRQVVLFISPCWGRLSLEGLRNSISPSWAAS